MRLALLIVFTSCFHALFCQDTLTISVKSFEDFKVYNKGEEFKIIDGSLTNLDSIGKVENKMCNYQSISITAHRVDPLAVDDYIKYLELDFKNNFSSVSSIELSENIDMMNTNGKFVLLKVNEKLPMKYIALYIYQFDKLVIDILKLQVVNDQDLEDFKNLISGFRFNES